MVKYEYDSWGKLISITGTLSDTIGVQNPFRYRGYYYDNETGMYYLKSRYYDPEIRRFISADKFMSVTELMETLHNRNLYSYCNENPIVRSDETGAIWGTIVAAAGAFVLGCVASIGTQMIFEGKSLGEVNGAEVIMSGVTTFMSFWGVNPVAQAIIGGVGEVWSCAAEGESLEVAVCNIGVGWIAGKLLKKIGIVEAKGLKQLTKDYNMHIKEVRDVNLGAIESIPYYIREQKIYDNATKRLGRYSMERIMLQTMVHRRQYHL